MHPDKGNQQQEDNSVVRPGGDFSQVTRAYAKLSGEEERRIHDATLLGEKNGKEEEVITINIESSSRSNLQMCP